MPRIYFYSHDGEGLGHFRRNLKIAEAVVERLPSASALLLTGSMAPGLFKLPARCDCLKVPTVQKNSAGSYEPLLGEEHDASASALRQSILRTALRTAPPDMLVVDKHPGGFRGELLPALTWLRRHSPGTVIVLGLRDVLDAPDQVEKEWRETDNRKIVRRFYDRVWIYGDGALLPWEEAFAFAPEVRRLAHSCGYISAKLPAAPLRPSPSPSLLATVGGGSDGLPVLEASLRAAVALREKYPKLSLRIVTGPLMAEADYRTLRTAAAPFSRFVRLERFSDRMARQLASADAVIAMAGYNTTLECVALGRPTVLVPREEPRREQLIRAQAFADAGLVRLVRRKDLGGPELEQTLLDLLSGNWTPAPPGALRMDGREQIVRDIKALLESRAGAEKACA